MECRIFTDPSNGAISCIRCRHPRKPTVPEQVSKPRNSRTPDPQRPPRHGVGRIQPRNSWS